MNKQYLGYGVYVNLDDAREVIILTAENGIRATDTIFIDSDTWKALKAYVEKATEL